MEYLIDTSVFVALVLNEPVKEKIKQELARSSAKYPCVVLTEAYPIILRKGLKKFKNKEEGRRILIENFELLSAAFECVPITKEASELAGKLALKYWEKNISYIDCLVAAVAILRDLKILTLDSDFSEIVEAKVRVLECQNN